jgi:AP-1 complex subunit beta-1
MVHVCGPEKSGGIEVFCGFDRKKIRMELEMNNISSGVDITTLAIQLNKNSFGLSPVTQQVVCNPPISPGSSRYCGGGTVNCQRRPTCWLRFQMANRPLHRFRWPSRICNRAMFFTLLRTLTLRRSSRQTEHGEKSAFIEAWKSIDDRNKLYGTFSDFPATRWTLIWSSRSLQPISILSIVRRPVPNAEG